jgi:hypothetical protein
VIGEEGGDGLEDAVDVEVAVGGLGLEVLDELGAAGEDLVEDGLFILEGEGEDDVAEPARQ